MIQHRGGSTMTSDTAHASPSPPTAPAASPSAPASSGHLARLVRWALWCAFGCIAIIAAYFGLQWWNERRSQSITEDAFVEAHIINVAPEMVSGRIVSFRVDENDPVKQGDVLAVIEQVHYHDQVEQARGKLDLAEAELKRQEAALTKLKNEVPLQIDVADSSADEARAAVRAASGHHTL